MLLTHHLGQRTGNKVTPSIILRTVCYPERLTLNLKFLEGPRWGGWCIPSKGMHDVGTPLLRIFGSLLQFNSIRTIGKQYWQFWRFLHQAYFHSGKHKKEAATLSKASLSSRILLESTLWEGQTQSTACLSETKLATTACGGFSTQLQLFSGASF